MQNYIHFSFLCLFKVIISTDIVIEVDILERVDTDPPDTPTLDSALATMQDRINMGQFSVSSSALIFHLPMSVFTLVSISVRFKSLH